MPTASRLAWGFVLAFLVVSVSDSQRVAADEDKPLTLADVEARLRETKVKVDYRQKPFADVLKHIAGEAGVEILIDAKTLEDEGVELNKPLTLSLRNPISAFDLLELTLHLEGELEWVYRHGVVLITTPTHAGSELDTRVYDCRDFLMPIGKAPSECQGFGPTTPAPQPESQPRIENDLTEVEDAIRLSVDPDTWDGVGGAGSTSQFRGVLVIRQTQSAHRKIARLLKDLRAVLSHRPVEDRFAEVDRRLDALVHNVSWKETPFQDVVSSLCQRSGIDFVVDERTLADEGIDPDEPITLQVKGPIRVRDLLRLVLEPMQLGRSHQFGVELVTTATHLGSLVEPRVYDCRDLAIQGDMGEIIDLLTTTIDPDTWEGSGAPPMTDFRELLIFRQTEAVHDQIAETLGKLRAILNSETTPPPAAQ